ncbi:sensor histidine kinase [Neolewinella persica]|uniref:sensor histidine kinase n=1 Tax=Neolewinella persica TaxID=70998 RepID=UPI00037B8C32|nr:histidine kinase [Neolewinella persica]
MQTINKMPLRIGTLSLWYLGVFLIAIRLRDFLEVDAIQQEIAEWSHPHMAALKISSGLAFFSYSLAAYLLLYFLYERFRWYLLLPALATLAMGCMFFRSFLEEVVILNLFGHGNYNPNMSWGAYLLDNLYYAILFTSLGIIYYFVQLSQHKSTALQKTMILQKETELKFLRSQVNPHFLFNTLNNLYALVHTNSPQALPALEKLSGLLRYSLYEQEPSVALEREVGYLRDLLHLESLRVDGLAQPQVVVGPFTREWKLPPLLLVPFVENAFKHGDLKDFSHPLQLSLTESTDGSTLFFRVKNLIRTNITSKDQVGGIGLPNVRKRLALLYPGLHQLSAGPQGDLFVVELVLSQPIKKQADIAPRLTPEASNRFDPGWSS